MVLSEEEAEARLAELRRRRETLDRAIADLALYLELGRRLKASSGRPTGASRLETIDPASDLDSDRHSARADTTVRPGTPKDSEAMLSTPRDSRARRYGRELIDAVIVILREVGQPLHARDILDRLSTRGFALPGNDPVAALNTRLWKRSGPSGPLRRAGKAVYSLPIRDDCP